MTSSGSESNGLCGQTGSRFNAQHSNDASSSIDDVSTSLTSATTLFPDFLDHRDRSRPIPQHGHGQIHDTTVVYLPRAEYDNLMQITLQYATLKQNLMIGGVDENTILLLSNQTAETSASGGSIDNGITQDYVASTTTDTFGTGFKPTHRSTQALHALHGSRLKSYRRCHDEPEWDDEEHSSGDDASSNSDTASVHVKDEDDIVGGDLGHTSPPSCIMERDAIRSLNIANLTKGTTHADVTAAIRGGQLLDIYMKWRDRAASISFVRGSDAERFLEYVEKHDLYIKGRRVDVSWNDRQYKLVPHLAHKIRVGATRNLVIRRYDPNLTETIVRADLDHIHNLVVVSIAFFRGDCFIETNSVSCAAFARTCMMSRLKYKGSRIEWAPDECDQPLIHSSLPERRATEPVFIQRSTASVANRFQLLDLED